MLRAGETRREFAMTIYAGFAGHSTTYIPSHDATGNLQVEFSRNPKDFALNKWLKLIPVKKDSGFYLELGPEAAARYVAGLDNEWPDGQEAPMGDDNHMATWYQKYTTRRYAFPFTLGNKAVEQADWNIIAAYSRMAAQQAMTFRTKRAIAAVEAVMVGAGVYTDTATALAGGKFDVGTSLLPYIRIGFLAVAEKIFKATYGVAKRKDLKAVMNPHTAGRIALSPEMIDFLKQQPQSIDIIRGDSERYGTAMEWNLPRIFQGFEIVIEDCVFNSARPTAGVSSGTPTYALADGEILFATRPEGLVGTEGVPNFATCQMFAYEDMTVETKIDPDNRRQSGRVVDDFTTEVAAPTSGYKVTGAVD